MSRRVLILALIHILFPLLLGGTGTADEKATAPARSVNLNNYNNWHFRPSKGVTEAERLEVVARRDNVCFTELWTEVTPKMIRALNPRAKVYRVYTLIAKPSWDGMDEKRMQFPISREIIVSNDWWLRDGDGRIMKQDDSVWFVDVGKPGVREAFLRSLLDRLDGQGFDGVVFDYWGPLITSSFLGKALANRPMPKAYQTNDEWFEKAWKPFIEYVTTGLHTAGYKVVGNCAGEYSTSSSKAAWQRSKIDGVVYEQWIMDWPANGSGWLSGAVIEKRIEAFSRDPLEVWSAELALKSSDPDYERKQTMGLALYYVAVPADTSRRSYHHYGDGRIYWEKLWDFNIGTPAADRVKVTGRYSWSREYTDGIVLLNCEQSESVTYVLDSRYKDYKGKTYSGTVTLPAHSALILQRAQQ